VKIAAVLSVAVLLGLPQAFRSSIEAVRIDVLVSAGGHPVRGLSSADFIVRDNGVPQSVDFVRLENMPLNVVLALDLSGSVTGARLADLRGAATAALESLDAKDRAAVITFSHAVAQRHALTSDRTSLHAILGATEPSGGTALIDAAHAAVMASEVSEGRGLVMIFSDGVDTASWLLAPQVVEVARRTETVVYAIVPSRSLRDPFLDDLCEATGGRAIAAGPGADLRETFLRVLDEFRTRYVISFTPRGVPQDGWHRLDVRVRMSGATVRARPGYVRDTK
jgi:Ca-activated chloride channel family protein